LADRAGECAPVLRAGRVKTIAARKNKALLAK
jgi:hypothetical protein